MQDQSRNIIIVVIFSMVLMVTLAAFIISIYFQYQKKQLLFFNNIDQLKLEHERNILSAQLEIQENTLSNISQEIHDNIGLSLTLAKLNLNSVDLYDPGKLQKLLFESKDLLSKAINDLSDLSRSLNAEVILNQGLLPSIEHEIMRLKTIIRHKVACNTIGEPYFIDSKTEVLLFRIFQETLNNILKHASASIIQITLDYHLEHFKFTVSDDGVGFNPDEVSAKKSGRAGIKNINKRAELICGKALVTSAKNQGTTISITIPTKFQTNGN